MADVAHQGQSGVINENKLGNDRESRVRIHDIWIQMELTARSKLVRSFAGFVASNQPQA